MLNQQFGGVLRWAVIEPTSTGYNLIRQAGHGALGTVRQAANALDTKCMCIQHAPGVLIQVHSAERGHGGMCRREQIAGAC